MESPFITLEKMDHNANDVLLKTIDELKAANIENRLLRRHIINLQQETLKLRKIEIERVEEINTLHRRISNLMRSKPAPEVEPVKFMPLLRDEDLELPQGCVKIGLK